MCLSVILARSGHVGPYMLPQTSHQILSLVVWGCECRVLGAAASACYSAFNPLAVLLLVDHLSCILNVAPLSGPSVTPMQRYVIFACTVP